MGKRAAQSAADKQAKVAKVEETVDPFMQELTPMLEHLQKAEMNESSIEMLQSVAPFCLKTVKDARHEFQQSMVDSIETTLKGIQAKQETSVGEAEKHLADLCSKQEQQEELLKDASEKTEQSRTEYESKAQTEATLQAETTTASEGLKAAQEQEEQLAREKAATLKDQESFEKFMSTFEMVKTGSFQGKEWRERNKAIDETMKVLAEVCDASLKASLPTALRTKPAERGRFSLKAINFCEVSLTNRGEKLKEKIESFDQEASNRAQKTCEAKEAFDAIDAKLTGAKAETATAKDQFDLLSQQKTGIEEEIKVGPGLKQKSESILEKAKEELILSQGIVSKFEEMKNRTQLEPEKAELETAQ